MEKQEIQRRADRLFLICGLVAIVACTNNTSPGSINSNTATVGRNTKDSLLRQCISKKDTVIDHANSVNYVMIDSFYTVRVRIGGLDTLLSYQFDCSVPEGLVPSFHSFYKNTTCLLRGYGFHYREFLIGYISDGQIVLKHYETALTVDLKNDIVVYRDYDQPEKIIVEGIKNQSKRIFVIPSKLVTVGLPGARIIKKKLELKFSDESMIYFSL